MSVLRLTDEQYQAAQKRAKRAQQRPETDTGRAFPASGVQPPSKYRNRATGGYASGREARRAGELKLLLAAGKIRDLKEQVPYILIPRQLDKEGKTLERECRYIADFVYEIQDRWLQTVPMWSQVVEDCKGVRTADYILKRKMMLHFHHVRILET